MFIDIPECGYHFSKENIAKISAHYGSKYMGHWAIKGKSGWTEMPVDVFYQPNPDVSKGHSHYFGMYLNISKFPMITNAESAFSEPIIGILTDDGQVIVSRYRHDYVSKGDYMIDGGRDYTKCSAGREVVVTVVAGNFACQFQD